MDANLRRWLAASPFSGGVAVVALGSFARRELCARSDVDLLLLHDGWPKGDLEALVQRLCYPLWDAGLSVGHAVRTPKQAVRAAADNVETATALTDRRLVVGDRGLVDDLAGRTQRWLRRHGSRMLSDLAVADAGRHERAGQNTGMLEPDLKAGAGGLRDLQSMRWAAAGLLGHADLDGLVSAGYLGARDRHELAAAEQTLRTARCGLHLVGAESAHGGTDRLRLDLQDEVAERLDAGDADTLLREVGLAMRTIAHVHGRTWPLVRADARGGRKRRRPAALVIERGLLLRDGLVELDDALPDAGDPGVGLRAIAAAAERGTHLSRAAAERLSRMPGEGSVEWDAQARAALLATLRRGFRALPAFADADYTGLLSAYAPEWERVRGHPQRNALHRFDLDTHLIQAVGELMAMVEGDGDDHLTALWEHLDDPDMLLLGVFLHDIGKVWPGDHSEAGAEVARTWVRRMGFEADRAERVARLVRLHLLLPRVATSRDLDDEREPAAVGQAVGDVETLDGLYLLSLADARATGPAASSAWKETLIGELHLRVRTVLLDGVDEYARLSGAEAVAAEVRREASSTAALEALLADPPGRYLVVAGAEQVAAHAALLAELDGQPLVAAFRPGPSGETHILSIVARDRLGLVADCAGLLAGHGLDVLDARAFTRADGVALDWFVVSQRHSALPADLERVLADAHGIGRGEVDVEILVARRERRRDERPAPGTVLDASDVTFDWKRTDLRIEVVAHDAPGLLYRIARALADAGLDVSGARVATLGREVRDVFFVNRPPEPLDTPALAQRLREGVAKR